MLIRLNAAALLTVTVTALLTGAVTGAVSETTGSDGVTYQADWRWDSAPLTADGADS